MLNFLQIGTSSIIFANLLVHATTPTISIKNPFLYLSKYSPLYSLLHVHKTIVTLPTNTPFPYNSAIFISLFFRTAIPAIPTQKAFSLPQPWKSLKSWPCFNICFLPWSKGRKKRHTSTDSFFLRFRKLMYCRK